MEINEESFSRIRHELRTSLNHIMGYSEILSEDAREYDNEDIIPELRKIRSESEAIREFITRHLDPNHPANLARSAIDVKAVLYRHVYEIIGTAQELRRRFEGDSTGYSELDLEKILAAANTILDIIDSRLMELVAVSDPAEAGSTDELISIRGGAQPGNEYQVFERRKETGTILIVDDNEMNREMLARHLERQGHTIVTAENGASAFQILNRTPIDLVILDIMMPVMNGYQVLERLKADENLRHIPVIMISALDDLESVIRCIEMGAEDYLPKSFDPVLLKARIEASLEKKRLRDQEQHYVRAILESQRILAGELSDAAEYVRNLLPPFLEDEVRTSWVFVPSAQLGGDSFGYHWLDKDRLAIYLLDVSGHGIGAALLSVSVMNVLRTQSLAGTDFTRPEMVLATLNTQFQMDYQNNMFFSIWYGVYHHKKRRLVYSSAGSPPAVLITQAPADPELPGEQALVETAAVTRLATEGMIVGIREDTAYDARSVKIPPESKLYLFSDGAYEIRRTNGRMLTIEEFIDILAVRPFRNGSKLSFVLSQLKGIAKGDAFEDDVSLLEIDLG